MSTIKYKFAGGICQYLKWEKHTTSGVFSKLASQREFLSPGYIAYLACTVGVLGIYAVLWQQIIKRMDVSLAYMFKGTGVLLKELGTFFVHPLTYTLICHDICAAMYHDILPARITRRRIRSLFRRQILFLRFSDQRTSADAASDCFHW